jgi:hypothetical protein
MREGHLLFLSGMPLPVARPVEGAVAGGPGLVLFDEEGSQQADRRLAVGEDADDAFAATDSSLSRSTPLVVRRRVR